MLLLVGDVSLVGDRWGRRKESENGAALMVAWVDDVVAAATYTRTRKKRPSPATTTFAHARAHTRPHRTAAVTHSRTMTASAPPLLSLMRQMSCSTPTAS